MNQWRQRFLAITATIAFVAFAVAPAFAGDPHPILASPSLPAGANQTVCGQMEKMAEYSNATKAVLHNSIVQQPSAFANCIKNILGQGSSNNAFASGLSGGFSLSGVLSSFMGTALKSLVNNMETQACQQVNGAFRSVQNGIVVESSITNVMGKAGGLGITGTLTSAMLPPTCPSGMSLLNNNTCCPTGQQSLIPGTCQVVGSTAPATAGTNPIPATTAPANTMSADQAGSEPDDLDNAVNSGGTTIANLSPMPRGVVAPDTSDTVATPGPKTVAITASAQTSPANATVCIPPDPRNDLSHDIGTQDGDSNDPSDTAPGTPANANSDATDDLDDPPNPVLPQASSPNLGDTPSGAPAQIASAAGPTGPGCSTAASTSSTPGTNKSTGTPCTANTKLSCIAGSGSQCQIKNGSIGIAKDIQTGAILSHGPYAAADGSNPGQCAQLVINVVPNAGHTPQWKRGPPVFVNGACDPTLPFLTPIATFFGPEPAGGSLTSTSPSPGSAYQYYAAAATKGKYEQHTGLFMGCTGTGSAIVMNLLNQYSGLKHPAMLPMPMGQLWDGVQGSLVRSKANEMKNAMNYYVIVH